MKITKDAKLVIDKLLSTGENNCLKVSEQKSCCGTSLFFTLAHASSEELKEIDGVKVLLQDEVVERIENVVIDEEEGRLIIIDEENGECC